MFQYAGDDALPVKKQSGTSSLTVIEQPYINLLSTIIAKVTEFDGYIRVGGVILLTVV